MAKKENFYEILTNEQLDNGYHNIINMLEIAKTRPEGNAKKTLLNILRKELDAIWHEKIKRTLANQ